MSTVTAIRLDGTHLEGSNILIVMICPAVTISTYPEFTSFIVGQVLNTLIRVVLCLRIGAHVLE